MGKIIIDNYWLAASGFDRFKIWLPDGSFTFITAIRTASGIYPEFDDNGPTEQASHLFYTARSLIITEALNYPDQPHRGQVLQSGTLPVTFQDSNGARRAVEIPLRGYTIAAEMPGFIVVGKAVRFELVPVKNVEKLLKPEPKYKPGPLTDEGIRIYAGGRY